jgi:hypothetical protein
MTSRYTRVLGLLSLLTGECSRFQSAVMMFAFGRGERYEGKARRNGSFILRRGDGVFGYGGS